MLKISQYTKIFFEYILDTNIGYTKIRTKNINLVSDNTVTHKRNATPEILSLKNSMV